MATNYSIYLLVLLFTFGGLARSNGKDVLSDFAVEGDLNLIQLLPDGGIQLSMTNTSKAMMVSKSEYRHGIFTANLKLPQGFSAGIVSSFYMTSTFGTRTQYQTLHQDEADFEFLGNTESTGIVIATNYYAHGVGADTHEEGFQSWFDPAAGYHNYTFQWGWNDLTFLVDNIPIRTIQRVGSENNRTYLQRPMQIQLSIWDASQWATSNAEGGAIPANYTLQPFSFEVASIDLSNTCLFDKASPLPCTTNNLTQTSPYDPPLTPAQLASMAYTRQTYMTYSNVIHCGKKYNNSCSSSPPPYQPPPPPNPSAPPPAPSPASAPLAPAPAPAPYPSSTLGGSGGGSGLSSTFPLGPPPMAMSVGVATRGSRGVMMVGWLVAMMVMTLGGVLSS